MLKVEFQISDELGYLVDAIVNEDKIGSFDKRPNDLSIEVSLANLTATIRPRWGLLVRDMGHGYE